MQTMKSHENISKMFLVSLIHVGIISQGTRYSISLGLYMISRAMAH
jgi:hypothetical protein